LVDVNAVHALQEFDFAVDTHLELDGSRGHGVGYYIRVMARVVKV
jgi:hypothetical protein